MSDDRRSTWVVLRPYPYGGGGNLALCWSLSRFCRLDQTRLCVSSGTGELRAIADPGRVEIRALEVRSPGAGLNHLGRIHRLAEAAKGASILDFPETFTAYAVQSARFAQRHGIPAFSTVLETLPESPLTRLPHVRRFRTAVAQRVLYYRTFTERAKNALITAGIPEDRIQRIPIGVDTELFRPRDSETAAHGPRILFARHLEAKNGVKEFVGAVELLRSRYPDLSAFIAGKGPLDPYAARAERKGLVRRLGWVPYQHLPELYRSADVLVNPAKDRHLVGAVVQEDGQYTFPLLEAQACGLGIVTTASGANNEILAPGNVVVPQGSVPALADGIAEALEPGLARRRASANRQFVAERFDAKTWQGAADQYVDRIVTEAPRG